jgi:hypothetical protein
MPMQVLLGKTPRMSPPLDSREVAQDGVLKRGCDLTWPMPPSGC